MLKHYVEFVYPGILFGDTSSQAVFDRDPSNINIPQYAVGFRFYDKEETTLDGEALSGKPKNYSGWFYKGKEMSLEKVMHEMPDARILIDNMKMNGYRRIVQLPNGQCYPLYEDDIVLSY